MNTVTRGHLAGLLLVDELDGTVAISDLITQASAAPEQGPVYQLRNTAVGNVWRDADREAYESAAGLAEYERRKLYTHADPSEVDRLRADKQYLQRTIDGMNEAHAEVAWRLSEAQALLRDHEKAMKLLREANSWITPKGNISVSIFQRIDAFLSATAQPAEVKS